MSDEAAQDDPLQTMQARIDELENTVRQYVDTDTDLRVRVSVLTQKINEKEEENTNIRVLAQKFNMRVKELEQILGVQAQQQRLTPEVDKKPPRTTKGRLKSGASKKPVDPKPKGDT